MQTKWMKAVGLGLVLAGLLVLMAGCEEAITDAALAIEKASDDDLVGAGATVLLTAYDPDQVVYEKASVDSGAVETNTVSSQIILPLKWFVSDPSLGRIGSSAGYNAVYESFGPRGANYITVEDAWGREGVAVVNQRWASEATNSTSEL